MGNEDIINKIIERYDMGDCLGFEELKNIATEEDCELLDKLIEDSWKLVDGTLADEDDYFNRKKNIFNKYGFIFREGDLFYGESCLC